jgi:CheY-like chemotaxis protein
VVLGVVIEAALQSVRPAAEAKRIALCSILDEKAGPVIGDPARLQQIAFNLLSNAIKFTPAGGKVQVVLQRVNSHIELSVADSGIGITADFLPHVFDRFRQGDPSTTRRLGGLGLGLAIVKHFVELHGGTVRAKSLGEGQGATFTVELPLVAVHQVPGRESHHPSAPRGLPLEQADLTGTKILVIDDDPDSRELIGRVLRDCGAEVREAESASRALALLEESLPSVIVSDIGMPEVDGYELLRRIRALPASKGGKVPAIALTAFARSEDRILALRAGFLVHVSKPVESSELIAAVAAITAR